MSETETPTIEDLRAKVFRDREREGDWRVEKMDDDGGIERLNSRCSAAATRASGRSPMPTGNTASSTKLNFTRTTARQT